MIDLKELSKKVGKKVTVDKDVVNKQLVFRTPGKLMSLPDSYVREHGIVKSLDLVAEKLK